MKRSPKQLMAMAAARWRAAEKAADAGIKPVAWVHLLAMGMCMAAAQERELDVDIEKLARDGGMFP